MTVQELNNIFGKNIKKYRILHDLSQERLAEKMDVSINTISEIETGKKFVRAETLIGFASVFKTEVYELFKPENILPDDSAGVLATYNHEVKEAMEKIREDFLRKMKGKCSK
jgi:transcriptional regulator with XRE-family HTH domain